MFRLTDRYGDDFSHNHVIVIIVFELYVFYTIVKPDTLMVFPCITCMGYARAMDT